MPSKQFSRFAGPVVMAALLAIGSASVASAATLVDPPGFYNGSGQPNTGFTITQAGDRGIGSWRALSVRCRCPTGYEHKRL